MQTLNSIFKITFVIALILYLTPVINPDQFLFLSGNESKEYMNTVTLCATVLSLFGQLVTSGLLMRRERRDHLTFKLDSEKKELEIKKLKDEIDQQKEKSRIITEL